MNGQKILTSGHTYETSRTGALIWGIFTPVMILVGTAVSWQGFLQLSWRSLILVLCVAEASMLFVHLSSSDGIMVVGAEVVFLISALPKAPTNTLLVCWICGALIGTWTVWTRYTAAAESAGKDGIAAFIVIWVRNVLDPTAGAAGLTVRTVVGIVVSLGLFLCLRIGMSLCKSVIFHGHPYHRATQAMSLQRLVFATIFLLLLSLASYPAGAFLNSSVFGFTGMAVGPIMFILFSTAISLGIISVRRSVTLRAKFTALIPPFQELTNISATDISTWATATLQKALPRGFTATWARSPLLRQDAIVSPRVLGSRGLPEYLVLSRRLWTRPFNIQDKQLVSGLVSIVDRVRRNAEQASELRTLANTDRLTGLPNYGALQSHLKHLSETHSDTQLIAIIFIDIDNFKSINDHYGHEAGNEVLRTVAARMQQTIRTGDLAARVGGDEFAIVLEDVGTPERARLIADRIATRTSEPIVANGQQIVVHISNGIAFSRPGQQDLTSMLETADQLMYATRGKSIVTGPRGASKPKPTPQAAMAAPMDESLLIQRGILEEHVHAVYQPILDVETGQVCALEALARYTDPDIGPVPVARLIGEAHRARLMNHLTLQILRAGLTDITQFHTKIPTANVLHVNFDIDQLLDDDFASTCTELVHQYPGVTLVVELNELSLNAPSAALREKAEQIAQTPQLQLGLDDLGKSHSSLLALCEYPIDVIKVDKRIIDAPNQARAAAGVKGALALGEAFHASVVLEGIETAQQAEWLRGLGARYQQGFFFSRPVPIDELTHTLHRGNQGASEGSQRAEA